ncbi:MAG: hypothetical protein SF066_13135, partial [Thermoanaerobaculia bacterium]|nr:hypothetical protein [Thermoanaerobaculia bacterium]
VHLFKLPIEDRQRKQTVSLAVYGVLVSASDPGPEVLAGYDRLFRETFRRATRPVAGKSVPLFEGQEYLKLKDLNIDTISLRFEPNLSVRVSPRSLFQERQDLDLQLRGEIRSNLTHHTVIAGTYLLEAKGPFRPDEATRREFGVGSIPGSQFRDARRALQKPIAPAGLLAFDEELPSIEPISLRTTGLVGWLKSALSGLRARYTGTVKLSFSNVRVKFERERLNGVFGSEKAAEVFQFKDEEKIEASPVQDEITFQLETSPIRGALLFVVLAPLAILAFLVGRLFLTQDFYRVQVDQEEKTVGLRRLRKVPVEHELQPLGRLCRPLRGVAVFRPVAGVPGVEVVPDGIDGRFVARLMGRGSVIIAIIPLHGSHGPAGGTPGTTRLRPGAGALSSSAASGTPAAPSSTAAPPSSLPPPTLGRPK